MGGHHRAKILPRPPGGDRGARRTGMLLAACLFVAVVLLASSLLASQSMRLERPSGVAPEPLVSNPRAAPASTPPITTPDVRSEAASPPIGSIVDTLDLVADQLLPGNVAVPSQDTPGEIQYDSLNGDLYVRSGLGAITVINGATDRAFTDIGTAGSGPVGNLWTTMDVDTSTGSIYVSDDTPGDGVTVIDGTTNLVTGFISTGGTPSGITFDPANGNIYVANYGGADVFVISGATNTLVGSPIPVAADPGAILYDPTSEQVFVAGYDEDGGVSIFNTSSGHETNITTGSYPIALSLDPTDDYVDVANTQGNFAHNATAINAKTDTIAWNQAVGTFPVGLAFAPVQDEVFVTNAGTENVSVISGKTGDLDATISTGYTGAGPESIAFDPNSGYVYVVNSGGLNITVINPATNLPFASLPTDNGDSIGIAVDTATGDVFAISDGGYPGTPPYDDESNVTVVDGADNHAIASIPLNVDPTGLTYDPASGQVIIANPGGNDSYLLDTTTDLTTGTIPAEGGPEASVYDSLNGDLYVLNLPSSSVTILNPSLEPIRTLAATEAATDGIAFDPANGDIYVTSNYGGIVAVIDGSTNELLPPVTVGGLYTTLEAVLYDPHNTQLYVANYEDGNLTVINGTQQTTVGSIPVGTYPDSLAFDPINDTIFASNLGSDNVTVINNDDAVVANIATPDPGLLTYDSATGVMYDVDKGGANIAAIDATNYTILGDLKLYGDGFAAGIVYDPVTQDLYVSTNPLGDIAVISTVPTYPVQFVETGLPSGTTWGVTLNGTLNTSTTDTIGFAVSNYTYPFTIGTFANYVPNVTSGSVTVNGAPRTIHVSFSPMSAPGQYTITFQETGLAASTSWAVDLNGTLMTSTTSSIQFTEPNGSYPFSVSPVTGYAAAPSSGSVPVAGAPVSQDITFTPGSGALTVTLVAVPTSFTLGNSTELTTGTSGGVPPFQYAYSGLPAGCVTVNSATLACTPTSSGSATITVTVTDEASHTAQASATVTVSGSSPNSPAAAGIPTWEWVVPLVVVVVVVGLLGYVLLQRRKKSPPPAPGSPPPIPPPPS